ncbi:MAG: hypothetical protein JWN48_2969 [Myxococcaceae bacterium]|nr:hypothetical protein [Myxococcaceae bacterium]
MTRLFDRARTVALVTAFLGVVGPADSAWAEEPPGARTHARASRTKKRHRSDRAQSSGNAEGERSSEPADDREESGSETEEPDEAGPAQAAPRPESPRAGDDEVISDPELRNAPPTPTSKQTDDGDEVISDPELDDGSTRRSSATSGGDGWGDVYKPSVERAEQERAGPRADEHDPLANTGISRLVGYGQFGADLHHEGNLEDAYETRLRFDAEVEFRRSKKVRLSIGVRTDLLWALPASSDGDLRVGPQSPQLTHDSSALQQGRFELDILPLSAYVDITPANGFHVRVGEQQVSIARMDFYSPMDMLAAFDMRGQIGLGQSTGKLAQPAVRVDWDLSSWATLELVYLPWFMPNLVRPNRDRFVSRELGTSGAALPTNIDRLLDPGNQTQANGELIRFVGPQPDFTNPQGQARLTMRGSRFEIAVSGGSALEKLPSIYVTPAFEKYIRDGGGDGTATVSNPESTVFSGLKTRQSLVDASYHRYEQIALDGSVDIAPLTLGFELAFSPSRHLVAASTQLVTQGVSKVAANLPLPNVSQQIVDYATDQNGNVISGSNVTDKSIRKGVPLVQGALHLDWIKGEKFAIAVEGFFIQALKLPYDKTRDWWGFVGGKGLYAGGILGGTYRPDPDNGRFRFDASIVSLVGPSLIFMPQVEYHLLDPLYVSVGAQFFEGPIPSYNKSPITGGVQNLNVGGLFSGYDQVYVGFRWVP